MTTNTHLYWVGTATGDKYIEADGYFLGGNHELKIEGQQPYICFYKGSRNNHVGMFVLKNITGFVEVAAPPAVLDAGRKETIEP